MFKVNFYANKTKKNICVCGKLQYQLLRMYYARNSEICINCIKFWYILSLNPKFGLTGEKDRNVTVIFTISDFIYWNHTLSQKSLEKWKAMNHLINLL